MAGRRLTLRFCYIGRVIMGSVHLPEELAAAYRGDANIGQFDSRRETAISRRLYDVK